MECRALGSTRHYATAVAGASSWPCPGVGAVALTVGRGGGESARVAASGGEAVGGVVGGFTFLLTVMSYDMNGFMCAGQAPFA